MAQNLNDSSISQAQQSMPESADQQKPVKKMKINQDFFSIGHESQQKSSRFDAEAENRDEVWRNIKPTQKVDALNKEVYKKRKYEEFRQKKAARESNSKGKQQNSRYKKKPKVITPEVEEKQRIQNFIKEIETCLEERSAIDLFKSAFRKYKLAQHPQIDEFCQELFGCFLGDKELAVCHLEVTNFAKRKVILLRLGEQVQSRHKDRYMELINCHMQACETKARTRNPFAQTAVEKLKAQAAKAAQEAQSNSQQQLSQSNANLQQCCICYKSENLYEAKCHHIACLGCWDAWLEKTLECPTCRQRTRKNQIYPVAALTIDSQLQEVPTPNSEEESKQQSSSKQLKSPRSSQKNEKSSQNSQGQQAASASQEIE